MADVQDPMAGLLGGPRPLGRPILAGTDDKIVKWLDCPDCGGRGYFPLNPFASPIQHRQCQTCETAHEAHARAVDSSAKGGA